MRAFLLSVALFPLTAFGQEQVQYTGDFRFEDGIYLSFEDFKDNHPIPIMHIVSDSDIQQPDYLITVLSGDRVTYYDNLYEERTVNSMDVWGFSQNGKVSIGYGAARGPGNPDHFGWYPLILIGNISYFTAVEVLFRTMPVPPTFGIQTGNFYSNETVCEDRVQVNLLLDLRDGTIIRLSEGPMDAVPTDEIGRLLSRDPELHSEFTALPRKAKKKQAMFFIRRFNERNPAFFPVYR